MLQHVLCDDETGNVQDGYASLPGYGKIAG